MSVNHIISGIYNSRIGEVILIGDSIILLDYEHQFIGSFMQWIVECQGPELCLVVMYIWYWSVVESL